MCYGWEWYRVFYVLKFNSKIFFVMEMLCYKIGFGELWYGLIIENKEWILKDRINNFDGF